MHPKSCKIRPEISHYSFAIRKTKKPKQKKCPRSVIISNNDEEIKSVNLKEVISSPMSVYSSYYYDNTNLGNSKLNLLLN